MALLTDLMKIVADENFKNRVQYCVVSASIDVMSEDPQTAHHQDRVNFARSILNGGTTSIYGIGIVANPTIAAEADFSIKPDFAIPDGDIQFTVNSEFNAFAGVTL